MRPVLCQAQDGVFRKWWREPTFELTVIAKKSNLDVALQQQMHSRGGQRHLSHHHYFIFFTQLEERLNEEIQHPLFGYKTSYRRCLELQTRLLAKALTGEIDS